MVKVSTLQQQDWYGVKIEVMVRWRHVALQGVGSQKDEEGDHQTEEPQCLRKGKARDAAWEKCSHHRLSSAYKVTFQ